MQTLQKIFFLLALLVGLQASAQTSEVQYDERTDQLVGLGKRYLSTESYTDAALTFELATQRPFNQHTTTAWYLAGISYFRMGEFERSAIKFKALLMDYPQTSYRKEAEYHLAMVKMESGKRVEQEQGLDQLLDMMSNSRFTDIHKDIETTLRYYLFERLDKSFVDLYYLLVDEEYKYLLMEAQCYKLDQTSNGQAILDRLKEYEEKGGKITPYLKDLRDKYSSGKVVSLNRINIAICLSLRLDAADTATVLPKISERGFELYQGVQMALDYLAPEQRKRFNIRIYDTRGDSSIARKFLPELEAFQPDVMIGEIRTSVNQVLGEWAESHKVVQFVMRNPLEELITNKKYIFLFHPTLETHGAEMAKFASEVQGKRNLVVFKAPTFFSQRYAAAFVKAANALNNGTRVSEKEVPKSFGAGNYGPILSYVRGLKGMGVDGVYLPLESEEWAGLIASELNTYKVEAQLLGSPNWEDFLAIDPQLKTNSKLQYSSNFVEDNDSAGLDKLSGFTYDSYCYPPTEHVIMGYDCMSYILFALQDYKGDLPFIHHIQSLPLWKGVHQDVYFGKNQSNQVVNIVQFMDGKIVKVNEYTQSAIDNTVKGTLRPGATVDPRGR